MSTQSPIRRGLRAALATAATALVLGSLVACASDTAAPGTTTDGDSTASGELTTIRVQTPPFAFEALELGIRNGIFEEHGLKIEPKYGGGDPSAQITQLIGGELDIVMSGAPDTMRAVHQGMPIQITGGAQASTSTTTGEVTDGLLVAADSPIQSWADLAGKNVGISGLGSLPQIVTNLALKQNGVDWKSVNYVNLPPDALQEAATNGQVDAILPTSVFFTKAVSEGFRPLGQGTQEFFPGAPQIVWVASTQYLEQNADAVKAFNEAMAEANDYANANPDEVRKVDHELTQLPPDFIDNRYIPAAEVKIDEAVYQTLNDAMVEFEFLPAPVTTDQVIWSEAPRT